MTSTGDGGIDIVVVNRDLSVHLMRNIVADRGNWIFFRVLDAPDVDAEGTIVTLTVDGRTLRRDLRAAYSYLASNSPRVHFGLGAATRVEGVTVRWIDGTRESYGSFDAGQVVTLRRGAGGSDFHAAKQPADR